jgi:hypothetical protein
LPALGLGSICVGRKIQLGKKGRVGPSTVLEWGLLKLQDGSGDKEAHWHLLNDFSVQWQFTNIFFNLTKQK